MTGDRVPAPLEAIIRAIAGDSRDPDDLRASTFARGLTLGALVGAAIAGSTIWQRRHRRPARGTSVSADSVPPSVTTEPGPTTGG